MEKYDLIIVGAGPAGIFTAVELLRHGSKKKILLVEKGKPVEKRHCPKAELGHCVNCRPTCAITTGFSGAGAFSDGKLSLSYEVGGDLPTLIGEEFAQELIDYTDKIYLEFGADPHVEGIYTGEDIKEIRKNAIHAGLKLVDCPIRHLGTEKAQQLYLAIQNYLADNGVEMLFSTECENIILENEECKGVFIKGPKDEEAHAVYADTVVIGTGRRGADWLEKICAEHHIAHKPGTVDIGVRVECRNEVMEKVNKVLYESKLIGYPKPWKNKVRTFCQNPGGFVAQENYDNDLAVVNGHSFKEKKSENTNLAILVSHNFTEPFNQPIAYAQKVGELTNMLGAGHIMVQRYGDILDGKRTWQKELAQSNVKPTLKDAVAGDITAAMPYRAMTNIIHFIQAMDIVVPGFASIETLLRLSRLPRREPKTFEGFDFSRIQGRDAAALGKLPSLADLYAHRNVAFVGPGGIGKTHLAQAYGRECCMRGLKTYYIKATELRDRFQKAVQRGNTSRVVSSLVKPSCLIVDEVGRCVYDRPCTDLFFDVVDRRYEKEGPNAMVLTSNIAPSGWDEFFTGDDTLLCALDRLFDKASVFVMRGPSYRGRELDTYSVEAVPQAVKVRGIQPEGM